MKLSPSHLSIAAFCSLVLVCIALYRAPTLLHSSSSSSLLPHLPHAPLQMSADASLSDAQHQDAAHFIRSHAPGHGGPAFHGGMVGGAREHSTVAYDYIVGLRVVDTSLGESLPTDEGEGREWVDVQRLVRDRASMGGARTRVLRPGDMATMDFVPSRLNINVGEDGKVASVNMG